MWGALVRDRIAHAVLLVVLLLWAPFYSPFAPLRDDPSVSYALQATTLVLSIAVCLWRLWEREPLERRFWTLITAGLGCWLGVHALEVSIDGRWQSDLRLSLAGDLGYGALYALVILALELRPHAARQSALERRLRRLSMAGGLVLVAALFAYFIGVAVAIEPALYLRWDPSLSLYVVLDLYLVVRLASLALQVADARWRASYSWLFAGVLGWLILDGSMFLERRGSVVNPVPDRMIETLWFVTPCLFAIGARARSLSGARAHPAEREEELFRALWGGPLLANAILIACVHLLVRLAPGALPAMGLPCQVVALTAILVLLGMAVAAQRLLLAENARLASEREEIGGRVQSGQRLEALGQLVSGVAHEFNNQLQVIVTCAEDLVDGVEPRSTLRASAQEIALAAERARTLTERLLSLARQEQGPAEPFDVNATVARTIEMLRRVVGESIRFEAHLDPRAGAVRAERAQLELVLLNLGVNARDALPSGGTIALTTRRLDADGVRWAVLEMKDDGVGMDAATRERIFEAFFTTKPDGAGTGLGLMLVQSFVSGLGGRIEVESAPGRGSTFRLFLPAVERPAEDAAAPDAPPRPAGGGRVLVVEDERAVRSVLCGFLQQSGFDVLEASDGVAALDLLASGPERPAFVLADVAMPRMGGIELAERARALHPGLPVVLMSGHAALPGGAPLLRKPFTRAELDGHLLGILGPLPARAPRPRRAPPAGARGARDAAG